MARVFLHASFDSGFFYFVTSRRGYVPVMDQYDLTDSPGDAALFLFILLQRCRKDALVRP
jgi:hypothetical protein